MVTKIKEKKVETGLTITNKMILPLVEEIEKLEITDKSSMAIAVEDLSRVNKYLDSVVEYKERKTKPLNDLKKVILAETKPLESALEDLVRTIKSKMSAYQTEQVRLQKIEEDKIANRIGEGKGKLKSETASKQIDALDKPEERVEAESGSVNFRTVRKFEVIDVVALANSKNGALFIDPVNAAINNALKAGIELPGVRYYDEQVPVNFR